MEKLLQFWDKYALKFSVIFTALFVVLYPKLPSIYITHTWVYIRMEDFVISILGIIWFIQLLRRKVRLALPLGFPIILYWIIGLASVLYSIFFIGPHMANYFSKLVALEFLRRIEYMILFFIAFSAIRTKEDVKDFLKFAFLGTAAVVIYGLAQHFYPYFWKYLPETLQKTNFCFPSFQTGNEEFAKGIPLCLPVGSRVTSTFGGHYDLAGYLIILLPIILGTFFFVKRKLAKAFLGILFITGLITLILTASRSAFIAYIFAAVIPLIFLGKKKFIIPVLLISVLCLGLFSESTIQRFAQTFRLTTVVVNMQGQVVGVAENSLSQNVQNQLKKNNKAIQANQVIQGVVPEGSSFITLPQKNVATSTAVVQQGLSTKEAQKLQLANGGLQLSTVKGNFSVQKALVYDISVTTRLQGEWPHAISSFLHYPLLGQGYSTLTLAVDNDFLRLLGESGILGFLGFLGIFLVLGIYVKQIISEVDDPYIRALIYGLCGGVIGLFVNATLFDIFESSKVAETLWIFLGVGAASLALYRKRNINFVKDLIRIITADISIGFYLFALSFGAFFASIQNFFIGDDFVWLKWAATSKLSDVIGYFTNAGGFFYRPLDKTLMLIFYSIFAFAPQGYHVIILLLHALMGVGVYLLGKLTLRKKYLAFGAAVLFLLLPIHAENVYWISSLSIDLSSVFLIFATIQFIRFRQSTTRVRFIRFVAVIVLAILGLLSYELALVLPLLLLAVDVFVIGNVTKKKLLAIVPFVILDGIYLAIRILSHAFGMGGDYSYNLAHFIPNLVGNVLGYIGLFIFGEKALPLYSLLRTSTKSYSVLFVILGLVLLGLVLWVLRKSWKKIFTQKSTSIFAIMFGLIALLPYLGLGNIAQRYGYLASVGFVLFLFWIVGRISEKLSNKKPLTKYFLGIISGAIVIVWCIYALSLASGEWVHASKITYDTLGYLRIEYPTPPNNSRFIFVNKPIQYQNAWVFPTGLPEALWFVYRDSNVDIREVATVSEAKDIAGNLAHQYIFVFDKTGNISRF